MKTVDVAALCVLVGVGCASRAENPQLTEETIVYTTLQPANLGLYLFERARSPPRRLITDGALDYNPAISPDGRWVVFTSERSGSPDLSLLELAHSDRPPTPLTMSPAMEDAAFSPDGRTLAFISTRDGDTDIVVIPFDPAAPGTRREPTNLTRHAGGDYNPLSRPTESGSPSPAVAIPPRACSSHPVRRTPISPARSTSCGPTGLASRGSPGTRDGTALRPGSPTEGPSSSTSTPTFPVRPASTA